MSASDEKVLARKLVDERLRVFHRALRFLVPNELELRVSRLRTGEVYVAMIFAASAKLDPALFSNLERDPEKLATEIAEVLTKDGRRIFSVEEPS